VTDVWGVGGGGTSLSIVYCEENFLYDTIFKYDFLYDTRYNFFDLSDSLVHYMTYKDVIAPSAIYDKNQNNTDIAPTLIDACLEICFFR
jgi:hypothetical protein